jgi:hypothetical protein
MSAKRLSAPAAPTQPLTNEATASILAASAHQIEDIKRQAEATVAQHRVEAESLVQSHVVKVEAEARRAVDTRTAEIVRAAEASAQAKIEKAAEETQQILLRTLR